MIAEITFFVSIFEPNVRMYEKNNRGPSDDFGFLFAISLAFREGLQSRNCILGGK